MRPYRDLVLTQVVAAVAGAQAVKDISHPGVKGRLREIFIRDLLRPLLPADIGLGTGIVVSIDNRQSTEQDVLLFDRRILPPILWEQTTGVFPVESVLFSIEVKSVLTATELMSAHDKAVILDQFPYHTGTYSAAGQPQPQQCVHLIPAIFAFDSDLRSGHKTEIQRYDELRGSQYAAIRSLCVVGKGNWFWSDQHQGWQSAVTEGPMGEVMGFLAGILNTYPLVADSRCRPRLGHYL